jgi:NADH-quinone oxidoreductase subunit F
VLEPVLTAALGRPRSWELADYLRRGGYAGARRALTRMTPDEVVGEVIASKLRGRGGGGFPTGVKWQSTRAQPGPRYLVVNADESEPGSFANRVALDSDPHMLLEGMIICAAAVDVHAAYIYIRGENLHGFEVLEGALREAYGAGLLGRGLFGGGFDLDVYVHRGAGAYVCGEETALMESLEGKRGQPRTRPPHPFQVGGGVFGRPSPGRPCAVAGLLPQRSCAARWAPCHGAGQDQQGAIDPREDQPRQRPHQERHERAEAEEEG